MRQVENDAKIFFLHDSFICKYSSASLKYFITGTTNLFITVMSELLAEGCVSFHYSRSPLLQGLLVSYLGKRGLLEALESAENK